MFNYFYLVFFLFFGLGASAQSNQIDLEITNAIPTEGFLRIGIYNTSVGFPDVDKTFLNAVIPVTGEKVLYTFNDVPQGTYCVSLFHDKNSNKIMDYNFVGMPVETYGFSKNIFHRLWAPTFEECSFVLESDKQLTINLVK